MLARAVHLALTGSVMAAVRKGTMFCGHERKTGFVRLEVTSGRLLHRSAPCGFVNEALFDLRVQSV